jgi:hypothetical protein
VLCCLAAAAANAAPPPAAASPPLEHIAQLISDLGSEEFNVREAASDELTRIGLPAFTALESASSHADREVRYRSQRILGLIREHDLKRRLEAFLSGKELAGEYPLPGWSRFKKTYGDEGQTRSLFVEMQRADAELMRAIEEGPQPAAEMVAQRMLQLQDSLRLGIQQQLSPGQVTAALFVAAEPDVKLSTQAQQLLLNQCYQQSFRDVVGKEGFARKMLAAIIRGSDDNSAYQAMQVAYQLNMPEGIVPALRILNNKGAVRSSYMTAYALVTVARSGEAAHMPLVEKLLTDTATISQSTQQNKVTLEIQVRDAALAAAILLTKQELKDYFDFQGKSQPSDPQGIILNPGLIGFNKEKAEDRAAVFKKWEAYRAKNPAASNPASSSQ